jgi:hypothetical protein
LTGFVTGDERHQGLVSSRELQLVRSSHFFRDLIATQGFFGTTLLPGGLGLFEQPVECDPSRGVVGLDRGSGSSNGR